MGRFLRLQWKKGKSKEGTSIDQLERQSWRQAVGAEGDVMRKLQEKGDWSCEAGHWTGVSETPQWEKS